MAVKHYDLARMTTATTGTGTITLGSAATGFLSFAGAGVQNGDTITYAIEDGNNREVGRGVYTASGTTLTRTVLSSTNANALISLSGTAQVFIALAAEDLGGLAPSGGASGYVLSKNSSSDYDFTWLAPAAGATTLAALTDVDESTAPTNGQLLRWNASAGKWQPATSIAVPVSVPATPPATAVQLFALYDAVPPMTSNSAPSGYTASASSAYSQAPAWGAFQSKLLGAYSGVGAGWITNATTTGWLQIQLPSAVVVSAYELASLPQFPARTPAAWTLAGSNDGTTWTTIDTQSGQTVDYWQTGATASVTQSLPRTFYVLGSATAYAYYRLTITANNGDGSYLAISQFKLLSATPNNFAPPNLYLMDANGSLAKIALLNQYGSWT